MARPKYRLPAKLEEQLARLFGEIVFHNLIYGDDIWPGEWKMKDPPQSVPLEVRGRVLVQKLEGFLQSMAEESDEFDDPQQTERLRSEATGILLALREMTSFLPEVIRPQSEEKGS